MKVLHPQRGRDAEAVGRFVSEMRTAQTLGHPNIAQVHGMSVVDTGTGELPCVVMELLEGRTLAEQISEAGPLSPGRAITIAETLAEVLTAAHAKGLVHRDLKAENVFLVGPFRGIDRVKVMDFGMARLGSRGTPAYLAPEQCLGFAGDESADVYALGVLLFEMLTGRTPYQGRELGELVLAHLAVAPPSPSLLLPTLPAAVDAIVTRALQKDPEHRFPSMALFLRALRDPASYLDAPVVSEPAPAPEPVATPTRAPEPAPVPRRPQVIARRAPRMAVAAVAAAATLLALVSVLAAGERARPHLGRVTAVSPTTVSLTVSSCAPGARVFLDGVEVGPAGESFGVRRGRPVDLGVRAPGFLPYELRVTPTRDGKIEAVLLPRLAHEPTKPEA